MEKKICEKCGGAGILISSNPEEEQQQDCGYCHGTGIESWHKTGAGQNSLPAFQAGDFPYSIVVLKRDADAAINSRDAEIKRLGEELDEMTARAISLSMHIPPETLAADIQQWRDDAKAKVAIFRNLTTTS